MSSFTRRSTRRSFAGTVALGTLALTLPDSLLAEKFRKIEIGLTGDTWPRDKIDQAVADGASLGFYGFETFADVLEKWEAQGGLRPVLQQHRLPLVSGYCRVNLTDPGKRKDEIARTVRWGTIIKKCGGRISVIGPNPVDRKSYNFAEHKSDILAALNETGKALSDLGLTAVLHQHTGTCVESRDETYAVMEAVDTNYVKFGPDVGQLTKAGSDAVQVVKDFLPVIQHMHLKDYNGADPHRLGYCPLGQGQVHIPEILDLMQNRKIKGMIMVELDNDGNSLSPATPLELIKGSKSYLQTQRVKFRS